MNEKEKLWNLSRSKSNVKSKWEEVEENIDKLNSINFLIDT